METNSRICIDIVRNQLQSMAEAVETALEKSINSLIEFDIVAARNVIEADKVINSFEIDIDNSSYNVLAVNAREIPSETLRLLLSIQKINPMLERIGDHAVNISESAETLSVMSCECNLFEIPLMAEKCLKIVHDALTSFFEKDASLAEDVLMRDDEIDKMNISISEKVKDCVMNKEIGMSFNVAMDLIRICKNLERVADLGSNIAEEAQFSILGRVVKHRMISKSSDDDNVLD